MLAARIFHFGEHAIADAKAAMIAAGITVRPVGTETDHNPRVRWRAMTSKNKMEYRRLGRSGLQGVGAVVRSWVTFDNQLKDDLAMECMQAAYDAGCNFFDNAEAYAGGESEAIMGRRHARARLAALRRT